MNYRHAFHAGNFADVIKHVALVAILLHLQKKEKSFRVIDTHAGRGLYDLASAEAARTHEWEEGIGRVRPLAGQALLPVAMRRYLEIALSFGKDRYPGSPVIAAHLLRRMDRLVAIERLPVEAQELVRVLARFANAKAVCADGYARLPALLPPPERRGLVLIDPPYEAQNEWESVVETLGRARRRFATGIYLVWHPVKSASEADALAGEVLNTGTGNVVRISIDVDGPSQSGKERLTAASLLAVNPPFGFAEEMTDVGKIVAPLLGRNGPARFAVEQL